MTSDPRRKPRREGVSPHLRQHHRYPHHRPRHRHDTNNSQSHPIDCAVFTYARAPSNASASDHTRTVEYTRPATRPIGTYGLFVGHGGRTASELCARNFVPTLLDDPHLHTHPVRALTHACQALEAFVLAKSALDRSYYGTTLLFVMLLDTALYVVNIGNSRALLASHAPSFQVLTTDHDCTNPDEVARVQAAGGFFHDGKVNDLIRVTRSIGDLELKGRKHVTFPNLNLSADVITPTPDVHVRQLSSQDAFVIMASPEVCKCLSNPAIVHIVRQSLRRHETSRAAAKRVAMSAVAAGAQGPVTVMLLVFASSRFPDPPLPPQNPSPANVCDDSTVHLDSDKAVRAVSDLLSPERRRTNPSIRPSAGKRLAASAARQLRSKGKWSAPPTTTPPVVATRRGTERRQHSSTAAAPTLSPPHSPAPTSTSTIDDSGAITTTPLDYRQISENGVVSGSPSSEHRPMSWRSDDENGVLLPTSLSHGVSDAIVTVPTLGLCDSDALTGDSDRVRCDRVQSALCTTHGVSGNGDDGVGTEGELEAGLDVIDVGVDCDQDTSVHVRIESEASRRSRGRRRGRILMKGKGVTNGERRQSHVMGGVTEPRRAIGANNVRVGGDERDGRGGRKDKEFVVACGNHRRGSGAWPMSELTSSTTTGRPSSRTSTVEVEQHAGELLDYGVAGPAKVRYREDGSTHPGRLGFFRELGWVLGRRR